jgi:hypothetical protein
LADWVKKNNMAGMDIDLEDNEAMNNHIFIPWIVGERVTSLKIWSYEHYRLTVLYPPRRYSLSERTPVAPSGSVSDLSRSASAMVHFGQQVEGRLPAGPLGMRGRYRFLQRELLCQFTTRCQQVAF